ncbi:MAG: pentapeptide repeat-containing protein [Alphaproteobacteria bacterium]|nr:pentapeptide repeat-containing protein [Alphaproteobacteria bacterium]
MMRNTRAGTIAVLAAVTLLLSNAAVAQAPVSVAPGGAESRPRRDTIWDLPLGAHAKELRRDVYSGFACGSDGGPPGIPLKSWAEFARCRAEPKTGFHEVYFRYDEELEYRSKALDPMGETGVRHEGTSEFQQPIIVSALFDDFGFLSGVRLVTDPRTTSDLRERGVRLADALQSRFGFAGWACEDLEPAEGETPYRNSLIKSRCTKDNPAGGVRMVIERHFYRKKGQVMVDAVTRAVTEGAFASETRFHSILTKPVPDAAARHATIAEPTPTAVERLAERVRNCRGCDLRGLDLKSADLRDAKLAGADLSGAILHAADLTGADLTGANLGGANLNRANLRRARLSGANLSSAMLYEARLDGADLTDANMSQANAARAEMTSAVAPRLIAFDADLRFARMLGIDLSGADLSGSWLNDAQLARSNLERISLVDARLWSTSLIEVNLRQANALRADLTHADLRGADLSSANFSSARMSFAVVANMITANTVFEDAELPAGLR